MLFKNSVIVLVGRANGNFLQNTSVADSDSVGTHSIFFLRCVLSFNCLKSGKSGKSGKDDYMDDCLPGFMLCLIQCELGRKVGDFGAHGGNAVVANKTYFS